MKENNIKSGLSLSSVLGVVFIVLKLCKVISWSWLWVLAPFWIPLGIAIVFLIVVVIMAFLSKDD